MNLKSHTTRKRSLAFLLSFVMVFSILSGQSIQINAASTNVTTPAWAGDRLYFHTIGDNTTDGEAWSAVESASTGTNCTPTLGSYSSNNSFRVFLPKNAKNSDNTYLVYNAYSSSVTIGNTTINSKETGYVNSNATTIRFGSGATCSFKVYTSEAEEAVYFTHNGSTTAKNGSNINNTASYVSALGLDGSKYSKADAVVSNPQITLVQADGTIDASTAAKQIKGRGNTTWKNTLKKSWNFTLNSKVAVGGMAKGKKYSLLANFQDPSLSRNRLLYDLADSVGVKYATDSRYADVYADGLYIGSYLLTEKYDSLPSLNDPTFNADGSVADMDFLIELACDAQGDDFEITPGNNSGILSVTLPDPADIASQNKSAIRSYIKSKYDAMYNKLTNSSTSYEELNKYIDLESLAKALLINELSKNFDAGVSSFYLCYEGGKFYAAPVWDYDNALGNPNTSPSVASDYKSPSGWWCKYWKGNNQNYSGNLLNKAANSSVVMEAVRKVWYGTSEADTTSFIYNINRFATTTSSNVTLGKNTGLLTKDYYKKVLASSAGNNFKKWSVVPSNWCGGHTSLNMYAMDYKALYAGLDTTTYALSPSVANTSSTRYYNEYVITSSSNAGGQYDYAADYMTSRCAWLSKNLAKKGSVDPNAKNVAIIYYKNTSYSQAYIHFKVGNNDWTAVPGEAMTATSEYAGYDWKYVIDLGNESSATVCFNNGSNSWDSRNGANYTVNAGTYGIQYGNVTTLTPLSTPTVPPTVTPTVSAGPTNTPIVTATPANAAVVYYQNSNFNNVNIHFQIGNGSWTAVPGVSMTATTEYAGYNWKYVIDLGSESSANVCFNNGANSWDSRNGSNYAVKAGTYGIKNGNVTALAPLVTPTVKPSATPTVKPSITPSITPSATPTVSPSATPIVTATPTPENCAVVYYENPSYSDAYIHFKTDGNWTSLPGMKMEKSSEQSGYTWKYTINLGTANSATVCFNNGSNSWDSKNGANYTVYAGTYGIKNASVKNLATDNTKITVYYNTGWSNAYVHYKVDNGSWTTAPGKQMQKSDNSAYKWMYVIDLGNQNGVTVCFNNGSNSWDSRNGANYYLTGSKVAVSNGNITKLQ